MRSVFIMLVAVPLLLGCSWIYHIPRDTPHAKQGTVDLRSWRAEGGKNVPLVGEWAWYERQFIAPQDAAQALASAIAFQRLPGIIQSADGRLEVQGTLILRLQGWSPSGDRDYSLGFKHFLTAGDFYWIDADGVRSLGSLGSTGLRGRPYTLDFISLNLPIEQVRPGEAILLAHVVLQNSPNMQLIGPPVLGEERAVHLQLERQKIERSLILGGFLLLFVLQIVSYWQFRQAKGQLILGLFSLVCALRYIGSEQILFELFDSVDSRWMQVVTSNLVNLGSTLYLYLIVELADFTFLDRRSRGLTIARGLVVAVVLNQLAVLLVPDPRLFTALRLPLFMLAFFALLFIAFRISWRSFRQKKPESGYFIVSMILLYTTIFNDTAVFMFSVPSIYMNHYGILVFAMIQAQLLGKRFNRLALENQRLLVEVQEQEKARTAFFHNTSHELRTPLNGMIGFMTLLQAGHYGQLTQRASEQINKCLRLADSLKNQVNTILDLAKSKKGSLALATSLIDVDGLFQDIKNLGEGLVLKKNNVSFQAQLSSDTNPPHFINDREKVFTIVRNLVGNAIKFADPVRPNTVEFTLSLQSQALHLKVVDTGIGIASDQIERIFEEFKQVDGSTNRNYEGTGLGLSMVRDLVKLMGGTIHVQSELGRGSTFAVVIPAQKEVHLAQAAIPEISAETQQYHAQMNDSQELEAKAPLSMPKPSKPYTILVVDDHEMNCEVIRDILEEEGYKVELAFGGREALHWLENHRVDLVLLDMMMPVVSGEDVIKAMKVHPQLQSIPVILITARASEEDRILGLRMGADDYLAKPLIHGEVLLRVYNLLERVGLQRHLVQLEERDRLVQLGAILSELSHEIKNIYASNQGVKRPTREQCQTILGFVPIDDPLWQEASLAWASGDRVLSGQASDSLSVIPTDSPYVNSLRYLRASILSLPFELSKKQRLWAILQEQSDDVITAAHYLLHLVESYSDLLDQSRSAEDLLINILDFSRARTPTYSEIRKVLGRVHRLLRFRLIKQGVNLDIQIANESVGMSLPQLMQISLNLLGNALDAMQSLGPQDAKDLLVRSRTIDESTVALLFINSGPKLADEIADRLFQKGFSTKGNDGNGLGLFIAQRLAEGVGGRLYLDRTAPQTTFVLVLPLLNAKDLSIEDAVA